MDVAGSAACANYHAIPLPSDGKCSTFYGYAHCAARASRSTRTFSPSTFVAVWFRCASSLARIHLRCRFFIFYRFSAIGIRSGLYIPKLVRCLRSQQAILSVILPSIRFTISREFGACVCVIYYVHGPNKTAMTYQIIDATCEQFK